ncbi:MAG: hypothetical protein AMJ56_00545 [Anaerolineae bacterium SG8_19]|nr:MAG: hypothetical protein AMJ56_00545 [Anaerolineae bacterium SG8_19]
MTDDLVNRLMDCGTFGAEGAESLCSEAADRIETLEKALQKIAVIEDEHINVPKTNEGANLWACLAMCVELAERALGEKKDG